MSEPALLGSLRAAGAELWLEGDALRFRAPAGALDDAARAELARERDAVIRHLRREGVRAPLSAPQRSFWLLEQLNPGHRGAGEQFLLELRGPLRVPSLQRAWSLLLDRHAVLTARFVEVDGDVQQRCGPDGVPTELDAVVIDLDDPSGIDVYARQALAAGFDVANGPLVKVQLFRLQAEHHALLVTAHHAVADGPSVRIIRDELCALYTAAMNDATTDLPPVRAYTDFVRGNAGEAAAGDLSWWCDQLAELPPAVSLPYVSSRAGAAQERLPLQLPAAVADRVRALARAERTTPFTVLLAAWRALLVRLSAQTDVPIGAPATLRDTEDFQRTVGCFANNLVYRTDAAGDPPFVELLRRERNTALEAFSRRAVPFERIVAELAPRRTAGVHPLFQVLFLYEQDTGAPPVGAGVEFHLRTLRVDRDSFWHLECSLTDRGPGAVVDGYIGWGVECFDRAFAAALPMRFRALLESAVADPAAPLSALDLWLPGEQQAVIALGRGATPPPPTAVTLHEFFDEQAASTPQRVALVTPDGTVSYGALAQHAQALATALQQDGVGPGDLVGIACERSTALVAATLAVLKAGAAYLPLDPEYPTERLRMIAADAGVCIVLADAAGRAALPGNLRVIDPASAVVSAGEFRPVDARPDAPAYVLYTSGSTGRPKGAVGLHRGAVNRCEWFWRDRGIGPEDVFALRTSLNFVDSVWEIFGALGCGARLVIVPDDVVREPRALVAACARAGVTHLVFVPALLRAVLDAHASLGATLPGLRSCITSGEPLAPDLCAAFRAAAPGVQLLNVYGTSEVWDVTCAEVQAHDTPSRVPVGRPIAGVQAHVLDPSGALLPPGVIGELCVSGAGVGPGYWQRDDLTAACYRPDPVDPRQLLYRTGDLARWRADGQLECLGRIDQQLKLRGHRIEPGELEAALTARPDIRQAAAALRGEPARLCAWIEAEPGCEPDVTSISRELRARLPAPLVPATIDGVTHWPLTPSGKIDRNALPEPREPGSAERVAPRTATEQTVAEIWRELLGADPAAIHDDFFGHGGDSMLATRLLARANAACATAVPMREFFAEPTLAGLAAAIDRAPLATAALPGGLPRPAELPLSPAQQRLWFLEQLDPGSPAYHIAFTLELDGPLDSHCVQAAAGDVSARHEALRTSFPDRGGVPHQQIHAALSPDFLVVDAAATPDSLAAAAARAFDIRQGPLWRLRLYRQSEQRSTLLVVMHHLVADGHSNSILFRELAAACAARMDGRSWTPRTLPFQYADYSLWLQQRLSSPDIDAQRAHWQQSLHGAPPLLELPTDRPRPAEQSFRGGWITRHLDQQTLGELRDFGRTENCTLFMVLLAGFQLLLHRWSGQRDLLIGTPVAGRPLPELEALLGLFINTVVVRTQLQPGARVTELLATTRAATLDAFAHQDLPFEALVDSLQPGRSLSRAPVFQVMFNLTPIPERLQQAGPVTLRLGGLIEHGVSNFDLSLNIGEHADGATLIFEYDSELFDAPTIESLADRYLLLLDRMRETPQARLGRLPVLTPADEAQLQAWQPAPRISTTERLVHERVAEWARRAPDAPAVIAGDEALSYAQLDARANGIAQALLEAGLTSERVVGIALPRGPELVGALLGVLKAGGAYLLLDPALPSARLARIAREARLAGIVSDGASLAWAPGVAVLNPTEIAPADAALPVAIRSADPAYLVYTSGSTGTPKGIEVSHGSLASAASAWAEVYALRESDRHLQMAAVSFDVFTGDWVRALSTGGALVICPRKVLLEPAELSGLLREQRITCAEFVPAVMRPLLAHLQQSGEHLHAMRLLIVGSEAWTGGEYNALRALAPPAARIVNSYGVAEATVDSTWFETRNVLPEDSSVPAGRAFPNCSVRVLDAELQPVPAGVPGELCISGPAVAAGYVGDAELTVAKFLSLPATGERVYRTGDRARWRRDGQLELLGRTDDQVKLRGFRIELGEIEAALQ
ncbi:MAG: amino acid adenylation domain-containing protein, partial [Chromatiales bacterium]